MQSNQIKEDTYIKNMYEYDQVINIEIMKSKTCTHISIYNISTFSTTCETLTFPWLIQQQ